MSEQRISSRARVMAIPAVGAVAFGVVAFGRGGFAQDATPGASPEASPSPMASPEMAGTEVATEAAAASGASVSAGDIFFDPKELTVASGSDVVVTNIGAAVHDWVVVDQNIGTQMLNPGSTETVTISIPAGEYKYECTVPGHAAAGMVGKLIVQ